MSTSATDARAVLAATARVAAADPCAFSFLACEESVREVNSRRAERSSAGRFITLFPDDDHHFVRLVNELHAATADLEGPVLLSDRPFQPGSLVHYRYGVFSARPVLGNDGRYGSVLTGPDGLQWEEDGCPARASAPAWAADPFAAERRRSGAGGSPAGQATPDPDPGQVVVAERYALTGALRQGADGGVFTGRDLRTGAEVVVKQGRAHIEVDRSGRDAVRALHDEASMLARLAGTGLVPRVVELVEERGQALLVEERIPGRPLGAWVAARLTRDGAPDVPWAAARPMALALVDLLARIHAEGVVLRDFAPGNVLVRADGALRLIDLELAAQAGALAGCAGTPGFQPPEAAGAAGPRRGGRLRLARPGDLPAGCAIADPSADLFALGGLFFLLATGHDPVLPEDFPTGCRPSAERLTRWLALAARDGATARELSPLITALRADSPADRPSLEGVRTALEGPKPKAAVPSAASVPGPRSGSGPEDRVGSVLDQAAVGRVLRDGIGDLAARMEPERADRLWATTLSGRTSDPCNVQHGAAGVLAVLARAAWEDGLPPGVRELARDTARVAARWIVRRVALEPVVLPGLHFGRSGTAWSLLDTAEALGDEELAATARTLAASVPLRWPNPDVCHGAAGAGFLQLRALRAEGEPALARVRYCADGLVQSARQSPYGLLWPVPREFDSELAGITHLGYAHGVAGVGAFLLAAAEATGEQSYLDAAVRAGQTLAATARLEEDARGGTAAWWPQSPGGPPGQRLAHWCSGSSGVGTFLIRLWRATGEEAVRELAFAAGESVLRSRWHSSVVVCHGLAGNGEFLWDLAESCGPDPDGPDPGAAGPGSARADGRGRRFREGARELAALAVARCALRSGRLVLPDETGAACGTGYGTGSAGVLGFLLRLCHGGPRLWTDPLDPASPLSRTGSAGSGAARPRSGSASPRSLLPASPTTL